jgi:hypothetical protein
LAPYSHQPTRLLLSSSRLLPDAPLAITTPTRQPVSSCHHQDLALAHEPLELRLATHVAASSAMCPSWLRLSTKALDQLYSVKEGSLTSDGQHVVRVTSNDWLQCPSEIRGEPAAGARLRGHLAPACSVNAKYNTARGKTEQGMKTMRIDTLQADAAAFCPPRKETRNGPSSYM